MLLLAANVTSLPTQPTAVNNAQDADLVSDGAVLWYEHEELEDMERKDVHRKANTAQMVALMREMHSIGFSEERSNEIAVLASPSPEPEEPLPMAVITEVKVAQEQGVVTAVAEVQPPWLTDVHEPRPIEITVLSSPEPKRPCCDRPWLTRIYDSVRAMVIQELVGYAPPPQTDDKDDMASGKRPAYWRDITFW